MKRFECKSHVNERLVNLTWHQAPMLPSGMFVWSEFIEWCEENITGRWSHMRASIDNFEIRLYFEVESDVTLYKLTWM